MCSCTIACIGCLALSTSILRISNNLYIDNDIFTNHLKIAQIYWWPLPTSKELPSLSRGCQTSEILKLDNRYYTHHVLRWCENYSKLAWTCYQRVMGRFKFYFGIYAVFPCESPGHHQLFSVLPTFHVQWSIINKICELLQERLFWHLQELLDQVKKISFSNQPKMP